MKCICNITGRKDHNATKVNLLIGKRLTKQEDTRINIQDKEVAENIKQRAQEKEQKKAQRKTRFKESQKRRRR